jgi:SPOR domain
MLFKAVVAAVFVATVGLSGSMAQTVADVGGPRELPPGSFKGQQYVDSRGCVFLRAGLGGVTNWVPRVDRARKVLCGYPPTLAALGRVPVREDVVPEAPVVAAAPVAPAPAPATLRAPMATVASNIPRTQTAPVRVLAPAPMPTATEAARVVPQYEVVARSVNGSRQIGCFTNTPVPVRVALVNGGTAVICTRGDGTLEGARAPIYPAGSGVGASLDQPGRAMDHVVPVQRRQVVVAQAPAPAPAPVVVPKGYKLAWDDDRLNPNRGQGTARGQAQQDQVWTRDVPAVLVTEAPVTQRTRVTVSTKSDATAAVPQAQAGVKLYVQVGTFGVPENAAGAKARLAGLGLPTAKGKINQGGKALQIVYAGPFTSQSAATAALRAARGAGFGDAFIR